MARKQSSTIWYQGNPHKEIYFQGHYHDKMYLGGQLIWEKLEDTGKYKWIPYISDFAIYNDETYICAVVEQRRSNGGEIVSSKKWLCKWNKQAGKIEVIKQLGAGYDYKLSATQYGIVLLKSQSNTSDYGDAYLIPYNFTANTEEIKIEENTIENPINIRGFYYGRVLEKSGIVQGFSTVRQDENYENYTVAQIIKRNYEGEIVNAVEYSLKMSSVFSSAFYFKNKYCISAVGTYEAAKPLIIRTDNEFTDANGILLTESQYIKNQVIDFHKGFLIHNNIAYLAGYHIESSRKRDLKIFSYDGEELKIEKELINSGFHLKRICYIDGLFFVFMEWNLVNQVFWVGKSIDTLKEIEHKSDNPNYYFGFTCPICDEKYIYVNILEGSLYSAEESTTNYIKIDKETLEEIEVVQIEAFNRNEE